MIVPMKKVSFVVLEQQRKDALKKLRRLGVVHLERLTGNSAALSDFRDAYAKADAAYRILAEIKHPRQQGTASSISFDREMVLAKAEEILALAERKKQCMEIIAADKMELERFAGWGNLDSEDFEYLAQKGILLSLYEIPREAYAELPQSVQTVLVPAEAYAVPMIRSSTSRLRTEIQELQTEIISINDTLDAAVIYKSLLQQCCVVVGKDIELENVYSGMGHDETADGVAEPKFMPLAWLSGFVPVDKLESVRNLSQEEHWAIAISDPSDDDEVPTQLKNNRFVSLIYPVSDFLGTVPGYREYDISGWFLLFFCLFFGIIFGDGGYGLLMVVAAVGAEIASIVKGKKIPPVYNLLLLLGFFTVAWGTVTCTWFGLPPEVLPEWLKALSFDPISNVYAAVSPENEALVKQNLQIFCFAVALVQLSIAHIKGFIRYIRSPKCLGEIGSLLMLWGIFFVVLNMVVKLDYFFGIATMGNEILALVGVGFVLSFIFSNYDGSLGASILESCKNIVSVLLGVVNVFSDIVSYIRLWAVGLAGSAISSTVNDMAGPTFGGALIFLGILLLVFGHGLNMILNVLSVIVHGVRLNTLEFSSHLGMSWSGFEYEPFCEIKAVDNK